MQLKDYQRESLESLAGFLALLEAKESEWAKAWAAFEGSSLPETLRATVEKSLTEQDPQADAWQAAQAEGIAASPQAWTRLEDGTGKPVPNVCLKVPTGGGKTLMAAYAIEQLQVDWLKRQTGLVLWIVPSQAIYAQTLAALKSRDDPLRKVLDRASAGRTRILEKGDRFTRADLDSRLCVMVLMLQSARREDQKVLKMFQGGGDASFFPQESDGPGNETARAATPNLDVYDLADGVGAGDIRRTLANVLRIVRPVVVLDEAHNAVTDLGRRTLAALNPRFILELTATPTGHSNVLVDIKGRALRDEEMIKLPINVAVDVRGRWQHTLAAALDKLNELDAAAKENEGNGGDYIRPILVVRVDFTGEKQRDRSIHVEEAVEWLVEKGGLDPSAIRRQTAEKKELGDEDLMSDRSPVRVVVTKDALREGWNCPFAYVLAILSTAGGATALTQFIGRVLRQPHARRTHFERDGAALDECYVFCTDRSVGDAVARVNKGLLDEGMGDLASAVRSSELGGEPLTAVRIPIRRAEAFKGRRVLLPRVLHADPEAPDGWRDLDYEADILGELDWDAITWTGAATYRLAEDRAHREGRRIDIAEDGGFADAAPKMEFDAAPPVALDRTDLVRRLNEVIPNPWQADRVLSEAINVLRRRTATVEELAAGRLTLLGSMMEDLAGQVDTLAEQAFRTKIESGDIVFRLVEPPLPMSLDEALVTGEAGRLERGDMTPLARALYTPVLKSEVNGFERAVALYLDDTEAVGWWWRIAARRDPWGLQGWRAHKVYPDFLVALDADGRTARLLALETKGKHLDNPDTHFKRRLFDVLERGYGRARSVGQMEMFEDTPQAVKFEILFGGDGDETWRAPLDAALSH